MWIPVVLVSLYLWIRVHQLKLLSKHIEKHYPDEWDRLQKNPMKLSARAAFMANLEASMLSGFLATVDDPKIKDFQKNQRRISVFFVVLISIGFIQALWVN